jgi:hypothetical protein
VRQEQPISDREERTQIYKRKERKEGRKEDEGGKMKEGRHKRGKEGRNMKGGRHKERKEGKKEGRKMRKKTIREGR